MCLYPEYDLDGKQHWLVAQRKPGTLHGFLFFNPDTGWSEEKVEARPYELVESAEAQVALLNCLERIT